MPVPDFAVHVTELRGDNLNKLIKGYVEIGESKIAFEGLVSSAQPGPNVNVSIDFPSSTMTAFELLGMNTDDIEELKTQAQQKIMDGEMSADF